jgi:hypothetical protein
VLVVVLELPTGALSDALGRRGVLALAAGINLVAFAVMVVAHSAWLFALSAALKGIGRALSSGPAEAWYVDTAHVTDPDADLRGGLAAGHAAGSAALAIGVLAGGFLPLGLHAAGWSQDAALATPAVLAAATSAALLLAVLIAMPEPANAGPAAGSPSARRAGTVGSRLRGVLAEVPRTSVRGIRLVLSDRVLALALCATMAAGLALYAIELLTPGRFASLTGGASEGAAGYAVVAAIGFAAAAGGSAVAPLVGRVVRTAPRLAAAGTVVAGGGVLALAATAGLAGTAGLVGVASGYAVLFTGFGLVGPAQSELLHGRVGAAERATIVSLDSLALQLAGVAGSLTLAQLAGAAGPAPAWYIAGGILAVAALAYLAIGRRTADSGETTQPDSLISPKSAEMRT